LKRPVDEKLNVREIIGDTGQKPFSVLDRKGLVPSEFGIPDEMADATAEMQEKGESGSGQQDSANPGPDNRLHSCISVRS